MGAAKTAKARVGQYTILQGDVAEVCSGLPDGYFDGCLCDPPYGLSFMGKKWDYDVPSIETWAAVLAALKPGAHLLAFAGTRTQHRMAVRIEDAGFEIRDMIAWVYGSGFPKSMDVSKAIDKAAGAEREIIGKSARHVSGKPEQRTEGLNGSSTFQETVGMGANLTAPATDAARQWSGYGTALKPALEPITVARKPLVGTVAANCQKYGAGAINVDGCRVGDNPGYKYAADRNGTTFHGEQGDRIKQTADKKGAEFIESTKGRWPANLILTYPEDEFMPGFPETGGGSAARFFYCAKASRSEREAGLEGRERVVRRITEGHGRGEVNTSKGDGTGIRENHPTANHHPTVKPIALAEYLARLILPPKRDTPRRLLVPFSGSGSEIIGALRAGWDEVWGIEISQEYVDLAEARIVHAISKMGEK